MKENPIPSSAVENKPGGMTMKFFAGTLVLFLCAAALILFYGKAEGDMMKDELVRLYSIRTGGYVELPVDKRSPAEWKKFLTAEQFNILREEGTERAFTGKYWNHHEKGIYTCAGCGTDLFSSETKFESGTGWPSFWQPVAPENIRELEDRSFFMRRVEVECSRCGGHLGHVFKDGPPPTGLRYCINSASLSFVEGLPGGAGTMEGKKAK
jgi:peptide-methionine (R)-S-oxide reductase